MTGKVDLPALMKRLAELRGTPAEWVEREIEVTKFVAGLNDSTRVFCRGEVRTDKRHSPAVLTHNAIYKQTLAWAPTGRKNAMESHHETFFWSSIPHASIAREVLAGPETRLTQPLSPSNIQKKEDRDATR